MRCCSLLDACVAPAAWSSRLNAWFSSCVLWSVRCFVFVHLRRGHGTHGPVSIITVKGSSLRLTMCGAGSSEAHAEPCVTRVAFSDDATALITAESRPPVDPLSSHRQHTLNFWDAAAAQGAGGTFSLNTSVADPHLGALTALACHPTDLEVVTTGVKRGHRGEGEFRIWARRARKPPPGAPKGVAAWHWVCRSCASYRGAHLARHMPSAIRRTSSSSAALATLLSARQNMLRLASSGPPSPPSFPYTIASLCK